MISKPLLWFIGLGVLGVLIVAWWAGAYPARVAVINQNANARDIVLLAGGERTDIPGLRAGETRIVRVPSGEPLELRFTTGRQRVWRSEKPTTPGASIILYIRPDDTVEMRDRIGKER